MDRHSSPSPSHSDRSPSQLSSQRSHESLTQHRNSMARNIEARNIEAGSSKRKHSPNDEQHSHPEISSENKESSSEEQYWADQYRNLKDHYKEQYDLHTNEMEKLIEQAELESNKTHNKIKTILQNTNGWIKAMNNQGIPHSDYSKALNSLKTMYNTEVTTHNAQYQGIARDEEENTVNPFTSKSYTGKPHTKEYFNKRMDLLERSIDTKFKLLSKKINSLEKHRQEQNKFLKSSSNLLNQVIYAYFPGETPETISLILGTSTHAD